MRPIILDATIRWGSTILTVAEAHLGQDDVGASVEGDGIALGSTIVVVMGPRTALLSRATSPAQALEGRPPLSPSADYYPTRVTIGAAP